MPNPLTQARKLGFPLVNQDGFLTGLARMAAGVSPMDQIKTVLDARKRFDEDTLRELENAGKATSNKTAEYNLGRAPIEDAQKDKVFDQSQAERAARGAKIAPVVAPGATPDEAIGAFEGQRDLYNLQNANPNEVLSPELGDMLGGSFKERIGQPVDRSQLQQGITVQTRRDAERARLDAAREAAAARADARRSAVDERRYLTQERQWFQSVNSLGTDAGVKVDADVLSATTRVRGALDMAKRDPKAWPLVAETITVAFTKLQDPNSVVREGEVTRLMNQYGLGRLIPMYLNKQLNGGVLNPEELKRAANMIEDIADQSHARITSKLQPLIDIADDPNYQFDKRYIRDPRAGFTPRSQQTQSQSQPPGSSGMPPGAATRRKNFQELP